MGEYQNIFNWLSGVIGSLIAIVTGSMLLDIRELKKDLQMRVHKEDYRLDIAEIKNMLTRIFDKLENKQDRS